MGVILLMYTRAHTLHHLSFLKGSFYAADTLEYYNFLLGGHFAMADTLQY